MTIIECFEKAPIENMISTLAARPDKLVFIGDESQMTKSLTVYKRFLSEYGYKKTKVLSKGIDKNNLNDIVSVLTEIVTTEDECIIDITGGDEMVLLGVGIVYDRYRDSRSVKLQKFNILNGKIIDCDGDREVSFDGKNSLTIQKLIALYGGIIAPGDPQPSEYFSAFDINPLWKMVCDNPKEWNRSLGILREFEARAPKNPFVDPKERLEYQLNLQGLSANVTDYENKFDTYYDLITKFMLNGFVENVSLRGDWFSYKYTDLLIRRCLNKAGDVLELKTYFEVRDLEVNGEKFFNDCQVGVNIDWDGVMHEINDETKDTRNEIDVVAMHGLIPVFISCKNGTIEEIEVYKLNTVAERFGGKYAKKVLIASDFKRDNPNSETAFKQRCKDMNIFFIENAQTLTEQEWKQNLIDVIKNPLSWISEADKLILT